MRAHESPGEAALRFVHVSGFTIERAAHRGRMDAHFENPDLEARIEHWVEQTGRTRDELVEDAFAGYFEELARTHEMLDSRYDDLKSGRVEPIDGDQFFHELRRREDELPCQTK